MSDMKERIRASEWEVRRIPNHSEAVRLVETWHYSHSAPNTSTYRHGLYPADEWMAWPLGAAIWIPPTMQAAATVSDDPTSVLCLSRLVVLPEVPGNGASFLLGRSMRLIDRTRWPVLLTYADTAHGHTGAIYKATNWECLGASPAGDIWVDLNGVQRGRKRGGKTLSAADMRASGFQRQPPLPKIKFIHRAA